jgi:DNA invertase Pin-like site-specific DNA recombinase
MTVKLRTPLKLLSTRIVRVLLYARFSTEEQKQRSIEDQFNHLRKLLKSWDIENAEIVEFSDRELSGELVSRPGIDQVKEVIRGRTCDLILAEDSSRLYRNPTACDALVSDAVDNDIRVILPGDMIDTEDENWREDLTEAQQHHTKSNSYTRRRIKRSLEGLWDTGAAIGLLRPGYRRRASVPATEREPASGPFYDEIDEKWAPIITQAYERVAREEPCWLVGRWLTEVGLPKCNNSSNKVWTARNVIELIRRPDYRGLQVYRQTTTKKMHRTGKSKQVRSASDVMLTRNAEHLRIVSDHLWYRANDKIDKRTTAKNRARGAGSPLWNVPRDSRGPLSNIFVCGACGAKMYAEGRREGGYRCSQAKKGNCWNRATALRSVVHANLGSAIGAALLASTGEVENLVQYIDERIRDMGDFDKQLRKYDGTIDSLENIVNRLLDQIESGEGESTLLRERLIQREKELVRARGERELFIEQRKEVTLPSRATLLAAISDASSRMFTLGDEVAAMLNGLLIGPIRALPFQQFGSNLVVLRAELTLQLHAILPHALQKLLHGHEVEESSISLLEPKRLVVDLFTASAVPQHALRALTLRKTMRPCDVFRELGVTKRIGSQALSLGAKLAEAGLNDPYVPLSSPPQNASRWRYRKNNTSSNDAA